MKVNIRKVLRRFVLVALVPMAVLPGSASLRPSQAGCRILAPLARVRVFPSCICITLSF
jgi:hypothetical protein